MNILHINKFHYLRGGYWAVYFRTAELLETYGHRSIFFSMHHSDAAPAKPDTAYIALCRLSKIGDKTCFHV